MKLVEMAKGVITDVKTHWSKPAKGNHISYKEMVAYSVGGMGLNFIAPLVMTYMALGAGSLLVGSTFGIKPMDLQIMNIISTIIQGFIITPIRGMIIDNTRSKYGKFRPYIATMGVPTVLLAVLFVYLPVDTMTYMQKAIAVFLFYNLIQITYNFYMGSYTNLVQVMSPNTEERATAISISSVIFSLAPTITGLFIPIISDSLGGMASITTYRVVMPLFAGLGLILSFFAFFGTRERLVVAKKYVPKVGFVEGINKMARNKYFWIIVGSTWVGALKTAQGFILPWLFVYDLQDNAMFGIFTTIMGSSALFPMLFAPIFIKKFGKKNLQVWTNVISAIVAALMIPAIYMGGALGAVLIFILLYIFNFANAFNLIVGPAMHAEMRDYQQYRTGDRLEGIEGTLGGLVGTFVTAAVGLIMPALFEYFGLLDNYNVLFDTTIRQNVFLAIALSVLLGSIITAIPFLFYDLSERKHYNIIKILKVRALFTDYRNGDLMDSKLVDTIEAIDEAIELSKQEKKPVDKAIIADAKALPNGTPEEKAARKKAIKDAKKEIQANIAFNERVDAAIMVAKEIDKFNDPKMMEQVELAKKLIAYGPKGLTLIDEFKIQLDEAIAMPATNADEFIARKKAIKTAKKAIKRAKKINKVYPEGIVEPDYSKVHAAFDMPENTKAERKARQKAIKTEEKVILKFRKVALPFIEAQKLVAEEESYSKFDELKAMYPAAKERDLAEEARQAEQRRKLEEERKAEIEAARQRAFDKLPEAKKAKILAKRKAKEEAEAAKKVATEPKTEEAPVDETPAVDNAPEIENTPAVEETPIVENTLAEEAPTEDTQDTENKD